MSIWLARFGITIMLVMMSFAFPASVFPSALPTPASATLTVPSQSDWTDQGTVLSPGPSGSWDTRLIGSITPTTVVELNGVFYLYYIGADGNRSTDGGPRHRALGVATSTDGIHFTKYSGNPVITHLPHNNEEEGVFSAAAMVVGGQVVLYYGAMDAGNSTSESVDGDIRLAVSSDGLNFTDVGDIVSHSDGSVWGSGDELFPVGVHQGNGTTNVYYIAKGSGAAWDLGLASGPAPDNLPNTGPALTSGSQIRGGTDPVLLDADTLAFFIVRGTDAPRSIEVWTAPTSSPGQLSGPVETYKFSDMNNATVTLGQSSNTWFMYHLKSGQNSISVRTAPAPSGDTPPPSGDTPPPSGDTPPPSGDTPPPSGDTPDAGKDLEAKVGDTVTLDGSGSKGAKTYSWTLTKVPTGSKAVLAGADTPSPSFVADLAGGYEAELVVNDGTVDSLPATVEITVTPQIVGQGLKLSKNSDFSTTDVVFNDGETVYILAWSDQVDLNRIKRSNWKLKRMKGSLTNNRDTTYTGQVVNTKELRGTKSGKSVRSEVEIRVEDQSGGSFKASQSVTLNGSSGDGENRDGKNKDKD